jgi:hypothetical protein
MGVAQAPDQGAFTSPVGSDLPPTAGMCEGSCDQEGRPQGVDNEEDRQPSPCWRHREVVASRRQRSRSDDDPTFGRIAATVVASTAPTDTERSAVRKDEASHVDTRFDEMDRRVKHAENVAGLARRDRARLDEVSESSEVDPSCAMSVTTVIPEAHLDENLRPTSGRVVESSQSGAAARRRRVQAMRAGRCRRPQAPRAASVLMAGIHLGASRRSLSVRPASMGDDAARIVLRHSRSVPVARAGSTW